MLHTEISPLADLTTTSLFVLPSEPGVPFGQSGISLRAPAAISETGRRKMATRTFLKACVENGSRRRKEADFRAGRSQFSDSSSSRRRLQASGFSKKALNVVNGFIEA